MTTLSLSGMSAACMPTTPVLDGPPPGAAMTFHSPTTSGPPWFGFIVGCLEFGFLCVQAS
jgi:hypothetical protein